MQANSLGMNLEISKAVSENLMSIDPLVSDILDNVAENYEAAQDLLEAGEVEPQPVNNEHKVVEEPRTNEGAHDVDYYLKGRSQDPAHTELEAHLGAGHHMSQLLSTALDELAVSKYLNSLAGENLDVDANSEVSDQVFAASPDPTVIGHGDPLPTLANLRDIISFASDPLSDEDLAEINDEE